MSKNHHEAGKGDTRRPRVVSDEKFKQNWNDIFKKKLPKEVVSETSSRTNR